MPADRVPEALTSIDRPAELSNQSLRAGVLLRLPAVSARVGMRRTKIYGLIKDGKFPSPVKIGKASAWVDEEITQWIVNLQLEREAAKRPPR
ncbi:AlpA family phage regulatory protein [Rhizobacter sp. J219]|uniref:AlpA family phage regulatory protein n=1 Tax=Rhizobacter sp. J219 TaxID=2898430 RepID=UPI0021507771|nr:AlpA family phage regulatory protein [Rhizobacter sp. J219]